MMNSMCNDKAKAERELAQVFMRPHPSAWPHLSQARSKNQNTLGGSNNFFDYWFCSLCRISAL
jgi:hypothetical protein